MPLFYQQNINHTTQLAIWKIEEPVAFFLQKVTLQSTIHHPHKVLQHLAGRYLLQLLFPDFPYDELMIADSKKPYLPNEQYHFSITHCGNYAAAIASKEERVGIDIEIPTQRVLKVVNKFLNEEEQKIFPLAVTNIKLATLLWCAKEAMFKWWSWGGVDFKKMLMIDYFEMKQKGGFSATIMYEQEISLTIQYKFFEEVCLCYTSQKN